METRTPNILFVEDTPELSEAYEILFRMSGLTLSCVADGVTALSRLREREPPDLVILDINLPDIDGLTLLAHIRDTPALRAVPVIMHSAQSSRRAEAISRGADAFIVKGVDEVDRLVETARELMNVA